MSTYIIMLLVISFVIFIINGCYLIFRTCQNKLFNQEINPLKKTINIILIIIEILCGFIIAITIALNTNPDVETKHQNENITKKINNINNQMKPIKQDLANLKKDNKNNKNSNQIINDETKITNFNNDINNLLNSYKYQKTTHSQKTQTKPETNNNSNSNIHAGYVPVVHPAK